MLSDTRVVVSDFIVKVKSFGRKSVDTTTVFENSFELLAFVNDNARSLNQSLPQVSPCASPPSSSSFSISAASAASRSASSSSSSASSDEGAGEEDVVEKMVDVGVAADALRTMSA